MNNEIDKQINRYERDKQKYKRSDSSLLLSRIEKNIQNLKQQKRSGGASKHVPEPIPYVNLQPKFKHKQKPKSKPKLKHNLDEQKKYLRQRRLKSMKDKIEHHKKKKKVQEKIQTLRRSSRIRRPPDRYKPPDNRRRRKK